MKNYFPEAKYAISKDYNHICSLYNEKLYDALDFYEEWQLESYNIKNNKKLSDFMIIEDEEIDNLPVDYGVINYINGVELSKAIIDMVDSIDGINIKKKNLS